METKNFIAQRKQLNTLRRALTKVATQAQDRIERGLGVRPFELALARAMDRKLAKEPSFGWRF